MKPTRTVKTADTLLSVIRNLQDLDGAGVTELAEHLGLAKSTVHDHLTTLREHGYVVKHEETYYLSLKFLNHGTYARNRLGLRETVGPSIGRLADDTEEAVWFAIEEHGELVHLYGANGDRAVDPICRPGTRVPIHLTAAGKAILATYPDERVREIAAERKLTRRTADTVTDVETLVQQLEDIRDDEVAITRGEDHEGVTSIAAVVSRDDETLGAVSVAGPNRRLSGDHLEETTTAILETVDEIALKLSMDDCS